MKSLVLPAMYLVMSALGGIIGFASNPDYYAWTLISLGTGTVAWSLLSKPSSRKVFVTGFIALGFASFVIGRLYSKDHQLDDNGLFALFLFCMLPAIPICFYLYKNERASAANDDRPAG
uniref:Uncharacterized protein n=1 Tax=uncultured bacterium HB1-14 TaxID=138991 RepID=Q99IZ7_9BACT|nr:unknown [uncultured bacterium HB1-14]